MVPEFVGNTAGGAEWATGTYWGRNVFKLNHEYAGLVVLLLAALAFFGAPRRGIRLTFLGIGGVALLFALGAHTPVWRVFYELVPGISLFRAPSISAFLFGFGAVTLMAFGVDRVLGLGEAERPRDDQSPGAGIWGPQRKTEDRRILWFLLGATGVLFLGRPWPPPGLSPQLWVSVLYPEIESREGGGPRSGRGVHRPGFLIVTRPVRRHPGAGLGGPEGEDPGLVLGSGHRGPGHRGSGPGGRCLHPDHGLPGLGRADANTRYLMDRKREPGALQGPGHGGSMAVRTSSRACTGWSWLPGTIPTTWPGTGSSSGWWEAGSRPTSSTAETRRPNLALLSILNVRYVIWPVYRYGGLSDGEPVMATVPGRIPGL